MPVCSSRRAFLPLLVMLSAALFAAACGGDDEDTSGGAAKSTNDVSAIASGASGHCGPMKLDGLDVVHHCGDASGDVTVNGETTEFDSGACSSTDDSVVLNLGTTIVDTDADEDDRSKHPYLGVTAGRYPGAEDAAPAVDEDGTFSDGVLVSGVVNGKNMAVATAELTLTDDRTAGTFSGTDISGAKVDGSFSCG